MTFRLRTKLTIIFVFISTLLIIFTGVFGKIMLESYFKDYVMVKQQNSNMDIVNLIDQQYAKDSNFDIGFIESIGIKALEQGQIIKVIDLNGKPIWDATAHNGGMCNEMLQHMADNMSSKYQSFNGKYTVNSYQINNGGTVEIGFYGPFYYSDTDLNFINTLNMALLWVAIFATIISFLLGHIFAKMLSTPISRVINTAKLIEQGNYSVKGYEKTSTKEINDLENTINNLSITLQKQDALRKRLTADVAHELRTPLATLQSHIEAMIDGIWQPTTERLKSCHEEIIRIEKMVGDLQLLTKYENEIKDTEKADFELNELIRNVIMNFESQFKNKGVEIHSQGTATIRADKDKISQVIINLLSNALKYTDYGGRVDVIIEDSETSTNIKVKDNGCGISEEDLPHIFERLYRADKSRNRLAGEAGIGLSIARAIVEAHNGTINVKSMQGVGTEFIISLPK